MTKSFTLPPLPHHHSHVELHRATPSLHKLHESTGKLDEDINSFFNSQNSASDTKNDNKEDIRQDNKEDFCGVTITTNEHNILDPDPWDVVAEKDDGPHWEELTTKQKIARVIWIIARVILILLALYTFICSLDVLQDAFHMLSGRSAGDLFSNNVLVNNPVSAMMIGVFVTVLVQSSSTSSSIVVSMVASGILTVEQSVPIVMGTNIGTTVTNTIVALTQSPDRNVFRRAFAGATVHDAFNWLTVFILLPLESVSHYLMRLTDLITKDLDPTPSGDDTPQFLKVITSPLTQLIIQIDKKVITAIAEESDRQKFPLAKYWQREVLQDQHLTLFSDSECETKARQVNASTFKYNVAYSELNPGCQLNYTQVLEANSTKAVHIFVGAGLDGYIGELATGGILLVASLVVMTTCLIGMVKILNSLFRGPMTTIVKRIFNAELPGVFKHLTGYMVMLVGMGVTILFQSSSVFTSALTPLVGMGLITVERMYPLTLGSNLGTTVTSILAAFTADAEKLKETLQVSLCHLFFNISGILLYYPLPFMRVPIPIAKMLGNTTAEYRWFAVAYMILMFVILPIGVFALSLAGSVVLMAVGIPLLVLLLLVVLVNVLQQKKPSFLPPFLRTWNFLPLPLRSLQPYDSLFSKCLCCKKLSSSGGGDGDDGDGDDGGGDGGGGDGGGGDGGGGDGGGGDGGNGEYGEDDGGESGERKRGIRNDGGGGSSVKRSAERNAGEVNESFMKD